MQVRVDGVVAAVLQLVGLQFRRDADAAPLLAAQVHDDAAAGVCDGGHRVIELGAAVAPAGAEDVTSQALAVNADEHRVAAAGVAHDEGQVVDAVDLGPPRLAGERAMTRRQRRLGDLADVPLGAQPVPPELGDGDHWQPMREGERLELRTPRHGVSVRGDDLGEHPGGLAPGEPGQIDRGLRVPGALEHPARAAAQRQDVAGANEVPGDGARIGERPERARAVGGRDARRDAPGQVDRHRERGALRLLVVADHQRQVELVELRPWESGADDA